MWTKGQGVHVADGAIRSYQAQIAELDSERTSVASDRRVVQAELAATLVQAATTFLPDAAPATLASAGRALGMPWLAQRRAELERKRAEWRARLAEIERDPAFLRRQALLHATRGELAQERQALERWRAELEQKAGHFEHPSFKWLRARQEEKAAGRGALGSFWDAVTFTGVREDKAKAKCCAELGYATYEELAAEHHKTHAALEQTHQRLKANEALRQRALALLEEHAKLYAWTHEFEPRVCEMLRSEVGVALGRVDLRAAHGTVAEAVRPTIAKAHALARKDEYLGNLEGFLAAQVNDRKKRIDAIAKTQRAWAMKPSAYVAGNKKGWLVDLPAAKHKSTHKSVRSCRRMHHNIIEFEDYDDYSYYLERDPRFLPYDAFAWGAEESMPYEGWSRAVIPELASYREEHGQDRADFGFFRSADKQAEREAREAERDAAREAERDAVDTSERSELEAAMDGETSADAGSSADDGSSTDDAADAGDSGTDDLSEAEAGLEADSADGGGDDVS
ncbi:MAG: hypothetical protein IPG04_18500 [Polyangiaceae bacterium]|nr:hypothetical protein [Polyangiaceae bacterium]